MLVITKKNIEFVDDSVGIMWVTSKWHEAFISFRDKSYYTRRIF